MEEFFSSTTEIVEAPMSFKLMEDTSTSVREDMSRCIPKAYSEQVINLPSYFIFHPDLKLVWHSVKHEKANAIYGLTFGSGTRRRLLIFPAILVRMDSAVSLLSSAMIPFMKKRTSFSSFQYLSSVKTLAKSVCPSII